MTAAALICPRCQGMPHRLGHGCGRCDDTGRVEPPEIVDPPRLILRGADLAHAEAAIVVALRRALWLGWAEREHFAATIARELARGRADLPGIARHARCDHETARLVVLAYVDAVEECAARVRRRDPLRGRALAQHARRVEMAAASLAPAAE